MHVREVPRQVFTKLVQEPLMVEGWDGPEGQMASFPILNRPPTEIAEKFVGEVDGFGLSLEDYEDMTTLGVFPDIACAANTPAHEAPGKLVGGPWYGGDTSPTKGHLWVQSVRLCMGRVNLMNEDIPRASGYLALMSRIALHAEELYGTGQIETSTFYEADVQLPPIV